MSVYKRIHKQGVIIYIKTLDNLSRCAILRVSRERERREGR